MKFESVAFESGRAELRPEMYYDLDKIIDFLLDNYEFRLRISGHTDSSGDARLNQELSQRRADAIRDYIVILHPVEAYRVEAIGYGSSQPIITNEQTEKDRQINRRVEFEIYRPAKGEK
jgi:outer membrane protein OmpA-like peptidoglycan-associated protein